MPSLQQRQEGVALPPLRRVQGLGSADPKAMATGGQGLQVEASEGTSGEEALEGGGYEGSAGVLRGHAGW